MLDRVAASGARDARLASKQLCELSAVSRNDIQRRFVVTSLNVQALKTYRPVEQI